MVLVLSRDGTPVLQPVFYGERHAETAGTDDGIEVIPGEEGSDTRRATLSRRLVDELAMQRRDVLALHVASDPGLALDIMVFTLADADTHDWRARAATTLRAPVPAGPIAGFEAKDAPASGAIAELRSGLDESWRAGTDATSRFDLYRALPEEARAAWLGYVVARSLEASLNMTGERQLPFQDHVGRLIGIDMAQWWRPTAANYFDRVSKQVILDALTDVGGLELSSRFAAVKKGDLAMSAERVFAGTYITEVEVREKALAWVPEVMRFASAAPDAGEPGIDATAADPAVDTDDQSPRELAA
jgi:ParB family chromosome partitioning protein